MYAQEKVENNKKPHVISDLPIKSKFIDFLVKLHAKQVLKKRTMPVENVIQNINIFY